MSATLPTIHAVELDYREDTATGTRFTATVRTARDVEPLRVQFTEPQWRTITEEMSRNGASPFPTGVKL